VKIIQGMIASKEHVFYFDFLNVERIDRQRYQT
jgi:hypothetical protein